MTTIAAIEYPAVPQSSDVQGSEIDPQLRPLPVWFFAFEGVLGGAYDLAKADARLIPVMVGVGAVNALISRPCCGSG